MPPAIPFIAGPSTLTTILTFSMNSGGRGGTLAVVIVSRLINMALHAPAEPGGYKI